MASSVDTTLSDFKINSVASEEVLKQMEQAGLLEPNQIYMTPDGDANLSYLRTEVVYDMSSSDSTKNWGYQSGINGGVTVSGKDFSKYYKLIVTVQFGGVSTQGVIMLDEKTTNTSNGSYYNGMASYVQKDGASMTAQFYVNNEHTAFTLAYIGYYYVTSGTIEWRDRKTYPEYRVSKIEGIIKTPAMIYTGAELFGSDTINITDGVVSSNVPYLETHFSSSSDQSVTGSSSSAASKTIKTVTKTLPKGTYLCYLSGVIKTSSYTGDLVFNINGTDIGSTMITNTSNYAGVSLVSIHSFAGGNCTVNIKIRSRATVTMCAYSTCNFYMIRVGD